LTIDRLVAEGREVSPESEREVREALRKEHGMGAYARLLLPEIERSLAGGPVVLDGLYSWSEYKILRERFAELFQVLLVYASPRTRYARLEGRTETESDPNRTVRRLDAEAARRRDYAEIERIEKGGPIAMADHIIVNEDDQEKLDRSVRLLLSRFDEEET
jgi:dephospho-CoA kinase